MARRRKSKIAATMNLLRHGVITLPDTLRDPPAHLGRVRIHTLLMNTPKLGEAGADKVLKAAQVWPTDRISTLDEVTRQRIIKHLPPRARM